MMTSNIINKKVSDYIEDTGNYLRISNQYIVRSRMSKYGNANTTIFHEHTFSFKGLRDLILVW